MPSSRVTACRMLIIAGLLLVQGLVSVAMAQSEEAAREEQIWQATDHAALKDLLQRRDAEFDRRSIVFDKSWVQQISPGQFVVDRAFTDLKWGQTTNPILRPGEKAPADYKQPYAWRLRMAMYDSEIVMENIASLKPIKDARFSYDFVVGSKFHSSNAGIRAFYPNDGKNWGKPIKQASLGCLEWSSRWCCGYGLYQSITDIETLRRTEDRLILTGTMRLLQDDKTAFTMELDRTGIVRRAELAIPCKPDGEDTYIIETEGTVRPPSTPAVAQSGRFRRILKPAGRDEQLYEDHKITFVSISDRLTEEQFQETLSVPVP